MANIHKVADLALANAAANSNPVDMERELGGVDGFTLGHAAGGAAGVAFIEVSLDYERASAATGTWLALKDAAGADVTIPVAGTARYYDTVQARAFRIRGGTSAAPANFAGNSTILIIGYTNAMGSRS